MPATDSFISSAAVVSTASFLQGINVTDSFTSSALVVASTASFLLDINGGKIELGVRGHLFATSAAGITVTKAPALGGLQTALNAVDMSHDDARELALGILRAL